MIGCAPSKKAIFLDPNFNQSTIDKITLLPAIDARIDASIKVNIQKQIRGEGMDQLKDKGFLITLSDTIGNVGQITEDLLKSGDSQWIKKLGPPQARWTMVLMLLDLSARRMPGGIGIAEVAGFLFDKEKGIIVWRDKGICNRVQSVFGMLIWEGASDATDAAIRDLMSTFPTRTKVKATSNWP
jgi:hypothetical protein